MILKTRFDQYRKQTSASWEMIQQDYALSWILAGISSIPSLAPHIVFKGGTCLRKCYFGDYRFSQDIDLTVLGEKEYLKQNLFLELQKAVSFAQNKIQGFGENVRMECLPYLEKQPHPEGQQAFLIKTQFPWQREPLTNSYVECTFEEEVLLNVELQNIIHPYREEFRYQINVYNLHEIIAEKIRALLQFSKKLHERSWSRSRVRDYYDLWRLFNTYEHQIQGKTLRKIVPQKSKNKGVHFKNISELFNEKLITHTENEWDVWLKDVVPGSLPAQKEVLEYLKVTLFSVFHE